VTATVAATPALAVETAHAVEDVRRRDVQGLRALAVMFVVAFHAGLALPGGFTGVDVFFVISGFVITGTLVRELERDRTVSLRRFYARRVRRLLPALATLLVVVGLLGPLLAPIAAVRMSALTGIFASLFGANGYLAAVGTGYFDTETDLDPLLHTWTLGLEEQFYVLFPVILLLAWRRRARRGALVAIGCACAGSFVLSAATLGSVVGGGWSARLAFYGAPSRAWEFAAGALVALAAPAARRLPLVAGTVLATVGLVLVGFGGLALDENALSARLLLLPVLGTCLALVAGGRGGNAVSQLLGTRPLVWIGDLSYSWYLWHWPLIVFAAALLPGASTVRVAAVAALLPAYLSYRFVETPIRRGSRFRGRAVVAIAAVCIGAGIAISGLELGARQVLAHTSAVAAWDLRTQTHLDHARGCHRPPAASARPGPCTWLVPGARGTIVLVGDSQAGMLSEPVVEAGRAAGLNVEIGTLHNCPFAAIHLTSPFRSDRECSSFNRRALAAILRLRPSLVVTAARSDMYVEDARQLLRPSPGADYARTPAEKVRLYEAGLRTTLGRLSAEGIPVLVVHPIPKLDFSESGHGECAIVRILAGGCVEQVERAAADRRLARARALEERVAATIPSISTLDFEDLLCGPRSCQSRHGSLYVYSDASHVSVAGARRLRARMQAAVLARARRS